MRTCRNIYYAEKLKTQAQNRKIDENVKDMTKGQEELERLFCKQICTN